MKHTTSRKNKKLPVEVTESTIKQRRKFALLEAKELKQKEIFGK